MPFPVGCPSVTRPAHPYDQRPTWLTDLHAALDRAVWAAYGWDDPDPAAVPDDAILARLLALNFARSGGAEAGAVAPPAHRPTDN